MTDPKKTTGPVGNQSVHDYHPSLSSSQKKRSKLRQVAEETAPPAEAPPPKPAPEPASPAPSAPLRRSRLKRSGQMHDDLTKPLPEDRRNERQSEY